MFPDADALHAGPRRPGATSPTIESLHPIRTAFTQKLPAVEVGSIAGISRSTRGRFESLEARGRGPGPVELPLRREGSQVRAPAGAVHICYCHTPMRYVWDRFEDYFGDRAWKARLGLRPDRVPRLRRWDRKTTASRVDRFVANSNYVARPDRAATTSERRRTPSFLRRSTPTPSFRARRRRRRSRSILIVSALVPYKRIDLAIDAFRGRSDELRHRRRKAPMRPEKLRSRARPTMSVFSAGSRTTRP